MLQSSDIHATDLSIQTGYSYCEGFQLDARGVHPERSCLPRRQEPMNQTKNGRPASPWRFPRLRSGHALAVKAFGCREHNST